MDEAEIIMRNLKIFGDMSLLLIIVVSEMSFFTYGALIGYENPKSTLFVERLIEYKKLLKVIVYMFVCVPFILVESNKSLGQPGVEVKTDRILLCVLWCVGFVSLFFLLYFYGVVIGPDCKDDFEIPEWARHPQLIKWLAYVSGIYLILYGFKPFFYSNRLRILQK